VEARRARSLTLLVLSAAACGSRTREAHPVPPQSAASTPDATPRAAANPEPVAEPAPTLDALASRQLRLAPGLRELTRGETSTSAALPPAQHDTCVRVAFAASGAATVSLVGKDGAVLAKAAASRDGTVGERGPVCFHAETEPRLQVEGDAGAVRYVVWGAP